MLATSARLLQLLALLPLRRDWTGPELSERLHVSTRTLRNDIERLRSLGYPIFGTPGVFGGYRLGPGTSLPPLLLDDEEAVAVAVGLRTAATTAVSGIEETALGALAKLEQTLPSRLRARVRALESAVVTVPGTGPVVDVDALTAIATAIRANERLRFDYTSHLGETTVRTTEPHRLVSWMRRWYLLAWDTARDDWRTFRVDRISPRIPTGPRFTPREMADREVVERVQRGVASATWRYRATVVVRLPAAQVAAKLPVATAIEPAGPDRCRVDVGSDTPHMLTLYLGLLDADFEVVDAPELAEHLHLMAARFTRAAQRQRPDPPAPEPP